MSATTPKANATAAWDTTENGFLTQDGSPATDTAYDDHLLDLAAGHDLPPTV